LLFGHKFGVYFFCRQNIRDRQRRVVFFIFNMDNKRKREVEFADLPNEIGSYILEYATTFDTDDAGYYRNYDNTAKSVCKKWYHWNNELKKKRIKEVRKDEASCMEVFIDYFADAWQSFYFWGFDISVEIRIDETRMIRLTSGTYWQSSVIWCTGRGVDIDKDILPGMTHTIPSVMSGNEKELFSDVFQIKAQYFQINMAEKSGSFCKELHDFLDLPEGEHTKRFTPEQLKDFVILKGPKNLIIWV
jgi:hypothetical protein